MWSAHLDETGSAELTGSVDLAKNFFRFASNELGFPMGSPELFASLPWLTFGKAKSAGCWSWPVGKGCTSAEHESAIGQLFSDSRFELQICEGCWNVVDRFPEKSLPEKMPHALAVALSASSISRGWVVFHAALLSFPPARDAGILVLGNSASGKSTFCRAGLAAGWTVHSDDLVAVKRVGDQLLAVGLRGYMKLRCAPWVVDLPEQSSNPVSLSAVWSIPDNVKALRQEICVWDSPLTDRLAMRLLLEASSAGALLCGPRATAAYTGVMNALVSLGVLPFVPGRNLMIEPEAAMRQVALICFGKGARVC